VVDVNGVILDTREDVEASQGEDGVITTAAECPSSPGTGNGYALTDVIDDLMAAEFPETTAPQADSEEVVLLSPTPPKLPPPPLPPSESEPEVDKPEVTEGDDMEVNRNQEDGDRAEAGHQGANESRVTLSGPLQFMGRNDLPRDDLTPPLSPVSSPVKLLDVLPATLRDAAAAEASLARLVPLTSGSIDAVTDDTQSPCNAAGETSNVDDQQEVFNESSSTVNVDVAGGEVNGQDEVGKTDIADADAIEPSSTTAVSETSEVLAAAAESSNRVSLRPDSMTVTCNMIISDTAYFVLSS